MKPNAINYLSLARKAGRIEVGEEPVGACTRSGHARLVLVAGDAPENTLRRARNFVAGTDQQLAILPFTKDEMGAALGRTSVALAAMTDPAMALAFLQALEDPKRYGRAIEDLTDRSKRVRQHRLEEKAHERNVRNGVKRREPDPKPKDDGSSAADPAQTRSRREERPERESHRDGYRKAEGRTGEKSFRSQPKADSREHKPWQRGSRSSEANDSRQRKDSPSGREYSREKKPEFARGEKPWQKKSPSGEGPKSWGKGNLRKPVTKSTVQNKTTVNSSAGRYAGRKTHGGAEK